MAEVMLEMPASAKPDRRVEGPIVFGFLTVATYLLIVASPIASGARGLSADMGRAMLAGCDVILVALFLVAIPYARARSVLVITLFVLALALAHMLLDTGFPPFAISYQGLRKSLLWLFAIVVGSALRERAIAPVCTLMLVVLALVCAYGIKQFYIKSSFDAQLLSAQSASIYANKIGQYTRATSVLSSGFHLGMAGCLLICLLVYARDVPMVLRLALIAVALFAIYASFTRTFLIIALVVLVLRVVLQSWFRMAAAAFVGMLTLIGLFFAKIDIIGSGVTAATSDDRFAGRSESYVAFFNYLGKTPVGWLIGFGPGTAGSTLGDQYLPFGVPWIEPHNIFTKYIFEFGLPAAVLLYASIGALAFSTRRQNSRYPAAAARMSLFVLFASGLTITSVETWPISIYVGLLLGMLCAATPVRGQPTSAKA